ncbi:MAG: gluconokinase [Betaproteobacteria bacterium]|jgi:carbohydrate kinase (thermoresistant glucokinase family)|nr:gluconokinase [Betaproteobacteria bacterium]
MIVVVMGVSGAGKTTLGRRIAERLGCEFIDADDYHPPRNVQKMTAGVPLEDDDRWPWLERLNALLRERADAGRDAVLACSALKEAYRVKLRAGIDDFRLVYLKGSLEQLRARVSERRHRYMPASLLESQLAALEPPGDAITVDASDSPEASVAKAAAALAP